MPLMETMGQPALRLGFGHHSCAWGSHLCGLYEDEAERDAILLAYLHQGDLDGDLQVYAPHGRSPEAFRQQYAESFPACAQHPFDPDQFLIIPALELYAPGGVFDSQAMLARWQAIGADAQRQGPRRLRIAAEAAWALDVPDALGPFLVYEALINTLRFAQPVVALCLYDLNLFSGAAIMQALRAHPITISRHGVTENPYYMPPQTNIAPHKP